MTEKSSSIEVAADAWDWREHYFFEELVVNADMFHCCTSVADFSQTLWEQQQELSSHNDDSSSAELRSLLDSTPDIDALLADSATFFQSNNSSNSSSSSQESSVEGDSDDATVGGGRGGENPRLKKRRLFNGPPQTTTTFGDAICDAPPPPASVKEEAMLLDPLKSFAEDPLRQQQQEEEGHGILSSIPAIWYASNDDSQSSLGDNLEPPPPPMMMSSENWMAAMCIQEDNHDTVDGFQCHKKKEVVGLAKQTPGGLTPLKILTEEVVLQGPLTPFSSRPSTPVNRTMGVKKAKKPSTTPVAYPFTLVKPLGIEGGMTLMDINELISTPPPPPPPPRDNNNNNYNTITTHDGSIGGGGGGRSKKISRDPRPNTKVDYGVGLSGKSIVTRTRICTKGNGTITIMRTKG